VAVRLNFASNVRSCARQLFYRAFAAVGERATRLAGDDGAQIVELAVSLPLLLVIFMGIYDFGQAFNLRQRLTGAAREGARLASVQSTADLSNSSPTSLLAIRDVVDAFLTAQGTNSVDDCGLSTATPAQVGSTWTWTFSASCGTGRTFTLTVNRGYTFVVPGSVGTGGNAITVEATQVSLTYPYQWQFTRLVQIVTPGQVTTTPSLISGDAVMQNLN
jgi:Flp pilus assembly protein TadG